MFLWQCFPSQPFLDRSLQNKIFWNQVARGDSAGSPSGKRSMNMVILRCRRMPSASKNFILSGCWWHSAMAFRLDNRKVFRYLAACSPCFNISYFGTMCPDLVTPLS